ncbi:WxL domain-containing protein, partial [Enterococcus hulanensis]|uniref:WxL domain-containing protein n=1 Tax=Enterococcus hulanensis TaxID=2559929 RepID=UPI001A8C336B
MQELDLSNNLALTSLTCAGNSQLQELDLSGASALKSLNVSHNRLTELDLSHITTLTDVECSGNELTKLNLGTHPVLTSLRCSNEEVYPITISELDLSGCPTLVTLQVRAMQGLSNLDLSNNPALQSLDAAQCNNLSALDLSGNPALQTLTAGSSRLTELDLSGNPALQLLDVHSNRLTELDLSGNPALQRVYVDSNQITELSLVGLNDLTYLSCRNNQLTNLDFLDATEHSALQTLDCVSNAISDITGAFGLTNLTQFNASSQVLYTEVPEIIDGNATVDLLRTTASAGLSATKGSILGTPILTPNGDKIELSDVTYNALERRNLNFTYSGASITEGSPSGGKSFDGSITFSPVSKLKNQLIPDITKVANGGEVTWVWSIRGLNTEKAENIFADLSLPVGLVIDTESIQVNGSPGTMSDIDGTNNLGGLDINETIEITFKTTTTGIVDEWIEATGKLNWEDTHERADQTQAAVQIKDDEQTFTPKPSKRIALLSIPESFRFGVWDVKNTAQVYNLSSSNYLTNTNVVSNGFYTRLRDDRSPSTGWKLSAQLSDFTDSANNL